MSIELEYKSQPVVDGDKFLVTPVSYPTSSLCRITDTRVAHHCSLAADDIE